MREVRGHQKVPRISHDMEGPKRRKPGNVPGLRVNIRDQIGSGLLDVRREISVELFCIVQLGMLEDRVPAILTQYAVNPC